MKTILIIPGSGGELFELSANQQSNVEIDSDAKWHKKGKRNGL